MADALILKAPGRMTAPRADTPKLLVRGDAIVVTSDSFSGTDGTYVGGRMTDTALGGAPFTWQNTNTVSLNIRGGRASIASPTMAWYANLTLPDLLKSEVLVEVTISTLPVLAEGETSAQTYLDLFRDTSATSSGAAFKLRATMTPTGKFFVGSGVGTPPAIPGSEFTVAAGDRIGVRHNNVTGETRVYQNGKLMHTSTDATRIYTGSSFGIAAGIQIASASWDDYKITRFVV